MGYLLNSGSNRQPAAEATDTQVVSTVTANAPGLTGEAAAESADETLAAAQDNSPSALIADIDDGPVLSVPSASEADDVGIEDSDEPDKPSGGSKIWDRRMVSAAAETTVNRLKRALSTDARRESPALDPLSRTHPVRVKVDGLQQKAVELLEEGDLQEAKAQAERAVDLSESLALEFLPNEEHPEDLLQRIVAAIDALDEAPSVNPLLGAVVDEPVMESEGPLLATDPVLAMAEPILSNRGAVAANRPLRLAAQTEVAVKSKDSSDLVEMGPILDTEAQGLSSREQTRDQGLAITSSADRLRLRADTGPLLVSAERRPTTPQIADAAPLPPFRSAVAPRPAPPDSEQPTTEFEWSDLWPLGVLGGVLLCFMSGLFVRRMVTGH